LKVTKSGEQPAYWLMVISFGLVLGFLTLTNYPGYSEFSIFQVPLIIRNLTSALFGYPIILCSHKLRTNLLAVVVMVGISTTIPLLSSIATAYLLHLENLLDVMVFFAMRTGLAHLASLFVFAGIGIGIGVVHRVVLM